MAGAGPLSPSDDRRCVVSPERFTGLRPSEELLGELTCPLCLHVLTDPHVLRCQHCFCKNCVIPWLRHKSTCPVCSDYARVSLLQPVRKISRLVSFLEFACENHTTGCSVKLPFSELERHQHYCDFQPRIMVYIQPFNIPFSKVQDKDYLPFVEPSDNPWSFGLFPSLNFRQQLKDECKRRLTNRVVFVNTRTRQRVRRRETPTSHGALPGDTFVAYLREPPDCDGDSTRELEYTKWLEQQQQSQKFLDLGEVRLPALTRCQSELRFYPRPHTHHQQLSCASTSRLLRRGKMSFSFRRRKWRRRF